MIRQCETSEFEKIWAVIEDAARAYRGVIPMDMWQEPYLPEDELEDEIRSGVVFWGFFEGGAVVGVMGLQHVKDVSLIRHAYVRTDHQGRGIGGELLLTLKEHTDRPILVGTWADAKWAIGFYQKHGFRLVETDDHARLLKEYWSLSGRQIETSVVMGDRRWFERPEGDAG